MFISLRSYHLSYPLYRPTSTSEIYWYHGKKAHNDFDKSTDTAC